MIRTPLMATLLFLPALATEGAAQRLTRPLTPGAPVEAGLTIVAKIGGKSLQATGSGACRHAPDASIHGVSASLWMVQYGGSRDAAIKQLSLTLWRPKDGSPDQLSLMLETKSGDHSIETGAQSKSKGQGTVTILPNGPGGRLELSGKEAGGKPIQLTIECPAFTGIEAEGG